MDVQAFLDTVRHHHEYDGQIVHCRELPARAARYAAPQRPLPDLLAELLRRCGIEQLFEHQVTALETARERQDWVVVTGTASGKTLCYNLPILQSIVSSEAKALYLFPTKALSQDQVAELLEINRAGDLGVRAYTFDGDTPGDARKAVRTRGDIVVSNPDMIHQGVLPHHTKWAQFFESLRYVVIDEMQEIFDCIVMTELLLPYQIRESSNGSSPTISRGCLTRRRCCEQ